MADNSIFEQAGLTMPAAPSPSAEAAPSASSPGLFEAAGLSMPGAVTGADAVESGIASNAVQPKQQGRGWLRAIEDYPAHVIHGLIETVKAPGNLMQSNPYPQGSEEWYWFEDQRQKDMLPAAVNIAGLATGTEFPRVGPAALTAAAVEKVAPQTRAINALVNAVGPENVPEAVARMQDNPRLSLADVSAPVRTMTQGLVDPAQPKVQNLVDQTVKDRQASLPGAVNSAYTKAMGPAPDVVKMVDALKQRAIDAGTTAIRPALEKAGPVDITPVIAAIDKEVKPGVEGLKSGLPLSPRQQELWRLRNQLTDPDTGEMLFDAQRLHEIQSQTGNKAYSLQKSPDGWTRDVGSGLRGVNEKLVDAIDDATGGAYRPARAQFKEAKDIEAAFESGFDTLKNRAGVTGLQDRPESFREWMDNATPEEVVARRLGTRADIDQKIRSVKNQALAGQTITRIEYNQQKLKMLFGEQEGSRLIQVMKDAQDEAETNAKLIQGSKTAETLAGRNALKVRQPEAGSPLGYLLPAATEAFGTYYGIPGLGLGAMGLKGAHLGLQKIGQLSDIARNYQFARNALATGSGRDATINALLSHPKVRREFKKRSNALTAQ